MVVGMANTEKVTVTLPVGMVEAIRGLVADGKAASVSGFVQHAVEVPWTTSRGGARCLLRRCATPAAR